jgi:DNA-binding transcriptional regulator LsrR (DeoR family)
MVISTNAAHHELLARVASMYYDDGRNQDEIGKALGLSRVKVYRLLKEAREAGVVQIVIQWPIRRAAALERALVEQFGLKEALVLEAAGEAREEARLRSVARLGASFLERTLHDGQTLAVCLGRSTAEVVSALAPQRHARVRVAQAVGSIPFAMQAYDGATIGRMLAAKLGGEALYLSSPLMADSPQAADVIRRQGQVRETLDAARGADVALVGIGALDPAHSRVVEAGFVSKDELAELVEGGAVGDMAGLLFTREGKAHPTRHNKRVIGVTLDELARIPTVLAVAIGAAKALAILGALRSKACNVLCTDAATADAVLALARDGMNTNDGN